MDGRCPPTRAERDTTRRHLDCSGKRSARWSSTHAIQPRRAVTSTGWARRDRGFSPFQRRWCWPLDERVERSLLDEVAAVFPGRHSFRAFAKSGQPERGEICEVTSESVAYLVARVGLRGHSESISAPHGALPGRHDGRGGARPSPGGRCVAAAGERSAARDFGAGTTAGIVSFWCSLSARAERARGVALMKFFLDSADLS